ncbi:MAG: D-galactonate dehydratase family protein [Spirochaetales bacterium]|nr:D-galactonate dehydratase family protein [Spirochaetales bacterium]
MKITNAKVIVSCPGRNFVTLKVMTDEGVFGLGDATLNGREKAVSICLEEHILPSLIGRDPANIEDIWHFFYKGAYWKRGGVNMAAISAVDTALWDIKGKVLGAPVYNLIGGRSRERIMVYAHVTGRDAEETAEQAKGAAAAGFRAVRIQSGIPGIDHTYGVPGGRAPYEPAEPGLPKEYFWDTSRYLNFIPKLFSRVRQACGDELHLLHDVHHRLTPIEAARLGRELEPFHPFWLEDPVSGELQEGLRLLRAHSTVPVAIGEVFNTMYDYTTLISEQLIDFIRLPPAHGGGITHALKTAAFASAYHIQTGYHGATDISPVGLAAALHCDLALNNFGIQEYMPHQEIVREVFSWNYEYRDGDMHLAERPGLGVEIDEAKAKKYLYRCASLPVNRKMDGTLHYW